MAGKVISTPYDAITYKIIGSAMGVHRELGPGLRKDSYQRALANSLSEADLAFEAQRLYSVFDSVFYSGWALAIGFFFVQ